MFILVNVMQAQKYYAKPFLVKIRPVKLTNSFSSMDVKSEARNISTQALEFN